MPCVVCVHPKLKLNKQPIESYAPIARLLLTMDDQLLAQMRHKFEICYTLAREGLAFLKYPVFHSLAERQGVLLGSLYKGSEAFHLLHC